MLAVVGAVVGGELLGRWRRQGRRRGAVVLAGVEAPPRGRGDGGEWAEEGTGGKEVARAEEEGGDAGRRNSHRRGAG